MQTNETTAQATTRPTSSTPAGELGICQPETPEGGRPKETGVSKTPVISPPTLAALGVTKNESGKAQALAALPTEPKSAALADLPDGRLWSVPDLARFLGKSPRWVWRSLTNAPEAPGSVPHVRVGASPRFVPEHIRRWVLDGCPPAATFKQWQDAEERRQKKAG